MKTSKVIGLLCTAIAGLNDILRLVTASVVVDEKIVHGEGASEYTHVHAILSPSAELVRELYDELPEELLDKETHKLVRKLYPHLYKDDYSAMIKPVGEVHTLIYKLYQEMTDAQNAAKIYS